MLHELDKQHYHEIAPLFESLSSFLLAIPSSLNSITPARILTDQFPAPNIVLLHSVEGNYLVGTPHSTSINALKQYLDNSYFNSDRREFYFCASDDWINAMQPIIELDDFGKVQRQHYLCSSLRFSDWRSQLAEGFQVAPIDAQLLASENLIIPPHIISWINNNWGDQATFFKCAFGMCVRVENRIVSWSLVDCTSGQRCEIGIHTHDDFRRRGLAAITAAACVEYALNNGFTQVGWHCNTDNIGSSKTAKKVGFIKDHDYVEYWLYRTTTP